MFFSRFFWICLAGFFLILFGELPWPWKTLLGKPWLMITIKRGSLWSFNFVPPKTLIPPFILEKFTWPFWRFHHISPPLFSGMIPWFHGFSWYAWPHKNIFHIHYLTIIFSEKLPLSKSVVQELNLNQVWVDGWVSILWEHLNYIQQQKRQDPFWDLGKWKKVPCCTSTQHNPCTQVCWVEKMWCPRTWHDMEKSCKINKVAREFCKFSRRVKELSIMSKNCKYPRVQGKTL